MRKKIVIAVLAVMGICFIVGLWLIFTAPDKGLSMSGSIVRHGRKPIIGIDGGCSGFIPNWWFHNCIHSAAYVGGTNNL